MKLEERIKLIRGTNFYIIIRLLNRAAIHWVIKRLKIIRVNSFLLLWAREAFRFRLCRFVMPQVSEKFFAEINVSASTDQSETIANYFLLPRRFFSGSMSIKWQLREFKGPIVITSWPKYLTHNFEYWSNWSKILLTYLN